MVWVLPASIIAAGQRQTVAYEDPPPWDGGAHCAGAHRPGAARLKSYIQQHFGIRNIGGYACRQNTANHAQTSVHGTGRALDIMVSAATQKQLGDTIANWLVANAQDIGIQLVIWDHVIWNPARGGEKWRPYTGPVPHTDHIHTELTTDGAEGRTPFFVSGILSAPILSGAVTTDSAAPEGLSDAAKVGLIVALGATGAVLIKKALKG